MNHTKTHKWLNELTASNNYGEPLDPGCYDIPEAFSGWVSEVRTLESGLVALAIGNSKKTTIKRAELIANAVNSFEAMRETLQGVLEYLEGEQEHLILDGMGEEYKEPIADIERQIQAIKATLTLANGKE